MCVCVCVCVYARARKSYEPRPPSFLSPPHHKGHGCTRIFLPVRPNTEDEEADEETESASGSQALLEVKSYFPSSEGAVGDQRDSLKGKEGCLHSRVKQCIRFVKNR